MRPSKIMIIRHVEKPSKDGTVWGVNEDGTNDNESLTIRGWQRAGRWCGSSVHQDSVE